MNRAVVIPFHRYQPHVGEGYRVLFEYFLKNLPLWTDEFDKLYIIDSDMDLDDGDLRRLRDIHPNIEIYKSELEGHHWVQYEWILPEIKEEYILFLDHDVIITRSGVIDSWFKASENGNDVVASFDNSGGFRDQIHKKFPFMERHNFTRMGSYYFILTKSLLSLIADIDFSPVYYQESIYIPELDYTAGEGDWFDSFGRFTLKFLMLKPSIEIIKDERSSIYLMDGGTIVKEPEVAENPGYYHIRHSNLANYVISSRLAGNMKDYKAALSNNPHELLQSLAWFYHMSDYDGDPLINILKDMNIRYKDFLYYFETFEQYYGLKI